jgi:hypothetical protein
VTTIATNTLEAVMEISRIAIQLPICNGVASVSIDMESGQFVLSAWCTLPYTGRLPDFSQTIYLLNDKGDGASGCLGAFKSWIVTDCRCPVPASTLTSDERRLLIEGLTRTIRLERLEKKKLEGQLTFSRLELGATQSRCDLRGDEITAIKRVNKDLAEKNWTLTKQVERFNESAELTRLKDQNTCLLNEREGYMEEIERWRAFARELGALTGCLPSAFADSNTHILNAVRSLTPTAKSA